MQTFKMPGQKCPPFPPPNAHNVTALVKGVDKFFLSSISTPHGQMLVVIRNYASCPPESRANGASLQFSAETFTEPLCAQRVKRALRSCFCSCVLNSKGDICYGMIGAMATVVQVCGPTNQEHGKENPQEQLLFAKCLLNAQH